MTLKIEKRDWPLVASPLFNRRCIKMFLEYLTDMSFILIALIGGIVALLFVFIKKRRA